MSLRSPWDPVPVLSQTRQPAGTPARIVASPVVLASSQPVSRSRPAGSSPSPRVTARRLATIADGVVVSRSSPGPLDSLSSGSGRSKRVTSSPIPRTNAVTAGGPPTSANSRFAAALSL